MAGQRGLWEDVTGRLGDISSVASFRANIAIVSSNSGDARTDWINDKSLDAWLIWNIWQVSNPSLAETVAIDRAHQIYRDCGIGLTTKGKSRPEPREFIRFLQSPHGAQIFQKWGWMGSAERNDPALTLSGFPGRLKKLPQAARPSPN
jgi:accessory colonization factor AcfC